MTYSHDALRTARHSLTTWFASLRMSCQPRHHKARSLPRTQQGNPSRRGAFPTIT